MQSTPANRASPSRNREIFTVSRLNREVRMLLETSLPMLWIEGEISNLARPASGHIYFTLKDSQAQVRCAMFRNRCQLLRCEPKNGMQVTLRARIGLYEARGEYQLVAESMEESGDGALQRAFEELKQRLSVEGLFDESTKQPIPTLPKRIGVVTSPTGAAIRDILSVLKRRFPAMPVTLYPTLVQGEGSAQQITNAINTAVERDECDVLIVGRGGGSLEDLWAFNEEMVARAIHRSPIPIVSAVGHEIDFTIADFVADLRAPTPSAAAELLSPDRDEWLQQISMQRSRLVSRWQSRLSHKSNSLKWLSGRLQQQHPGQQLRAQAQRLDELELRLRNGTTRRLREQRAAANTLEAQLRRHTPTARINTLTTRLNALDRQLGSTMLHRLDHSRQQLGSSARALNAISPLATLDRGYAIVKQADGEKIIRSADEVEVGDRIETRLGRGRLRSTVEETQLD